MAIYTPSNPYTTSWTFHNLTIGDLSFSSIVSTEADWGYFSSFTDNAPDPFAISVPGLTRHRMGWLRGGFTGPNASTTFTINYNVNVTNPDEAITSLQQLYLVDELIGPGASTSATEQAYTALATWWARRPGPGPAAPPVRSPWRRAISNCTSC